MNGARKAKTQNEQRLRKMPETTQKLSVAMFRMKRERLTAWGTWYKVKDEERKENHSSILLLYQKARAFSTREENQYC